MGQVLAIKSARVSDYQGKSINAGDDHSQIFLEPNEERTIQLQQWYAGTGGTNLQSISGGLSGEGGHRDNHRLIKEVTEQLFKDDQFMAGQGPPQYFKISGYVQRILYDDQRQSYFIGCPECKKKLQ